VGISQSFATYYARSDRLHVLVQIPDEKQFWSISPEQMDEVATKLRAIGVRALIAPAVSGQIPKGGWIQLSVPGATDNMQVLILRNSSQDVH
jgi:hypothetical protein